MSYPALSRECDSSCWDESFCVIQTVFAVSMRRVCVQDGNWKTACVHLELCLYCKMEHPRHWGKCCFVILNVGLDTLTERS